MGGLKISKRVELKNSNREKLRTATGIEVVEIQLQVGIRDCD